MQNLRQNHKRTIFLLILLATNACEEERIETIVSIDVKAPANTLFTDQEIQLTAVPRDAEGNPLADKTISWSSNNQSVATINQTGLMKTLATGTVKISATSGQKTGNASFNIVNVPVAAIMVSPDTVTMQVGQTQKLVVLLQDSVHHELTGRLISWQSTDEAKAVVSNEGLVTAKAMGKVIITATCEGKTDEVSITVTLVPIASIIVSPNTTTVAVGKTRQLTALLHDAHNNDLSDRTVIWSSSEGSKAQVSASGLVTAIAEGSLIVTATSEGKSGQTLVEVFTQPPLYEYTTFEKARLTLQPWYGQHYVLLTPQVDLDYAAIRQILNSLDHGYEYYQMATGREPVHWAPYTLNGRGTVASVQKTCGGACGYLGYTGIEMIQPWVDELYNDVKEQGVHHTTFFYEMGRNFWFYSDQLWFESGFNMDMATGYAELMKQMATDYIQLPLRSLEAGDREDTESTADFYLASPSDWTWRKVVELGETPPIKGHPRGAHILFTALILRLQKEFGGHTFIERFWQEVGSRSKTTSIQHAIDNLAVSVSAGANANLSNVLLNSWRFSLSDSVKEETRKRFGNPL